MIGVEIPSQSLSALGAATSADQGKDEPLANGERPPHLLTQYSVNTISRIGRFGGGFSTACLLIRTIAVA